MQMIKTNMICLKLLKIIICFVYVMFVTFNSHLYLCIVKGVSNTNLRSPKDKYCILIKSIKIEF